MLYTLDKQEKQTSWPTEYSLQYSRKHRRTQQNSWFWQLVTLDLWLWQMVVWVWPKMFCNCHSRWEIQTNHSYKLNKTSKWKPTPWHSPLCKRYHSSTGCGGLSSPDIFLRVHFFHMESVADFPVSSAPWYNFTTSYDRCNFHTGLTPPLR